MSHRPNREQLRQHRLVFWNAWAKAQDDLPMNALEVRIARVISMHPEHQHLFNDKETFLERDFHENDGMNPYLHWSLHLALEEQIATRQPPQAPQALEAMMRSGAVDRHGALHRMLEALAETVYYAQRAGADPDVRAYEQRLSDMAKT